MICGIYKLSFTGTDKVYIGQSIDIPRRFSQHIWNLEANQGSRKLQEAYNTYGIPNLEIIITCAPEELDIYEEEAISVFNSVEYGLNILRSPGGKNLSSVYGENNNNSKYSNEQILEAFYYLCTNKYMLTDIEKLTGVHDATIGAILRGTAHTWIKEIHPDEYSHMLINVSVSRGKRRIYPKVISPEGIVYDITNVSTFAKEHGLLQAGLCQLVNGKYKTHKGWKIYT